MTPLGHGRTRATLAWLAGATMACALIATIPEVIWELGLSFYPLIWGFRHVPIVEEYDRELGFRGMPAPAPA